MTREDFTDAVVRLLAQNPHARVMVIVDNGDEPDLLQSEASLVWAAGLISRVAEMLNEKCREARDSR